MLCRSCGLRASSSLLRRVAVSSFTCLHGISQRSIASQSTERLSHSDHNGSAAHEQLPRVPQKQQQQQQQLGDEVQLQLQPRICESIAEAEAAVEAILAQTMESARERLVDAELAGSSVQLSLLLKLADSFWRSAQTSVYLPRNIYAMDDFGLWLLKVLRSSFGPRRLHEDNAKSPNTSRFASMDDDAVMQEFDEWVETCMAEQRVSCTSATAELLPYTMLMDVVHAYIRYHKGVAWGVSSANTAKDDEERGSFYRRRYLLHPWFRVDCPDGPAAQLPHVHVLQWMRSRSTTREASGSSSALTTFTPPSLHRGNNNNMNDEVGFAALDLCSQSGHVTELLLKAGATRVVAVDATTEAVGNTESTVHDVQRERRSSSRATVEVLQSPFLPLLSSTSTAAATTAQEKLVEPANTFFAAAQRRRRLGHRQRWGSEATTTPPSEPTSFDVIYVHPPLPSLVPFDAHAGRGGSLVGLRSSASASDAARHPHATRETLQRLASHFRGEVDDASPSSSSPLLLTGGYLVFVLPRSYDIHDLLCSVGGGMRGSLAEDVLRELGDAFQLVQHRAMRGIESNSSSHAWLRYAVDQLGWGRENLQYMERLLRSRIMIDVLIVKKLASSARAPSRQKSSSSSSLRSQRPTCVGEDVDVHGIAWEDSAEYDEYKPRSCHAPTQFHWSDRMPSYGFLQDDYVSSDVVLEQGERRSHNVLAHGFASPLPSHGTTVSASMSGAAVQRLPTAVAASSRFQSIFAAELRTTRRRKLRKLATAPIHQQEWFIDEKLIKSEAAKVDFMNELSKWDLQDYDD